MRTVYREIPGHRNANELLQMLVLILPNFVDSEIGDHLRKILIPVFKGEVVFGEVEKVSCVADREGDTDVRVL